MVCRTYKGLLLQDSAGERDENNEPTESNTHKTPIGHVNFIYGLFQNAVTNHAAQRRMTGRLMNNELVRTTKDAVVAYFKAL
jgi:hypothetical protein